MRTRAILAGVLVTVATMAWGADPPRQLYVVATSHLDTQWRWTIQDTIDYFLPATLRDNFALFEKYPGYVFSFEGAFRYQLAKEYYPAEFERLKGYVKDGRWKVAGSWVDAVDTNVPSPESLVRQALYGNGFLRRELGVTSRDVFLPDCFGFGFALPSVAAHCGLTAFSTQKLTWGAAMKIPFDIGLWEGIDGSALVASLNPGDYASEIKGNLTLDPDVYASIDRQKALSGLPVAVRYFGTGDTGIAPLEPSVALLQQSLAGPGPLKVRSVAPDQLARDLMADPDQTALQHLPRYRGELLLTSHGAGCYTSQAAMKRFNRKNERLADAVERAAVTASWLGGLAYPRQTLREAWTRFLWHQFHDDLTGTSIPEAYVFSWNDEAIAGNQLADVLNSAVGTVVRGLDTQGSRTHVVYNPLSIEREDVVEATVRWNGPVPPSVQVTDQNGGEVPAQRIGTEGDQLRVAFVARVAPVSFTTFTIRNSSRAAPAGELKAGPRSLENASYRVTVNEAGDLASVFDKRLGRELLAAPAGLQLFEDQPRKWAAWEVEYSALSAPPREVVGGPATIRVVENGPARVALEVVRQAAGSTFTQRLSLAAGAAGDRVEILTDIDWRTKGTLLKAAFPLAAASQTASYDLGLGVVNRETNRPNLYEVPAQQWADLTDASGAFGTAILDDSRYGWDKPDDHTLRLTLVHTPRVIPAWDWIAEQGSNDLGHHRVLIALAGHAGDWRTGHVPEAGDRLNQPLLAWQVPPHPGPLGRSFSLLRLEGPGGVQPPVAVRAVKLAEESDEVIVRLQELAGTPQEGVRLAFARPVVAVREVNGAEEPLGRNGTGGALSETARPMLALRDGVVELAFAPFRPRTLALRLGPPPTSLPPLTTAVFTLPWNLDGISRDEAQRDGSFDGVGQSLAGELLPETVVSGGVPFNTGPQEAGKANVVVCGGQRIPLPQASPNRLYLLAAAIGGDRPATFEVDGKAVTLTVPDWAEPVGQWNSRLVGGELQEEPSRIAPAYAKTTPVAWVGTHRHGARGENQAYVFTHLYRLRIDLPPGAKELALPNDEHIRVVAMTAAWYPNDDASPAQSFTDPPRGTLVHVVASRRVFTDRLLVTLTSPSSGATIRYTLDGSEPDVTSPTYLAPLAMDRTTTVKARAFAPSLDDSFVATATFTKVAPHQPAVVDRASLAPGLACRLYEGEWRKLPDFDALTPARSLVVPTVSLPADRPKDRFGLVCNGFLSVPADGLYTLALRAEDGAELRVNGERVILEDGIDFMARRTELALGAGLHPIEVRYFQRDFVAGLELHMDGPDAPLALVPAERMFHLLDGR
ncbi:MAG TPA: glycoside hydrolase family 38 C-terminal domain-containing protein [Thermoanaerobaculaceae bacterium]|nr:glycoside hydrolase family 38 C-terminal domain-containing protein [Thermoanaerobaculaceae bacterium]